MIFRNNASLIASCLLAAFAALPAFAQESPPPTEADRAAAQQKLEDAQRRLDQAAREVAELSAKAYSDRLPDLMMFLGRNPNRAILGIGIGGPAEKDVDDGAQVFSVSPGGPAAKAGIKAGDVITELNGKALKREKETSPRQKLVDEMGKLNPGDEVTVTYRRDGKSNKAKLTTERVTRHAFVGAMPFVHPMDGDGPDGPRVEKRRQLAIVRDGDIEHGLERAMGLLHGGAFGSLELVPLTPKLGQYFGTEKGLLIVRAPQGKDSKLEDGDVLLDIDGRTPTSPGHAYRIFGSYQPGEKLTVNVLRQKKKLAVTMSVPDKGDRIEFKPARIERRFEMPAPPAPPANDAA